MLAIDNQITCHQLAGYERLQTPIWIFDIQYLTMRWANRAALLLWNAASLEELLSRDLSQVSPATQTRLQNYLAQFEQGETVVEQWTFYPEGNAVSLRCHCSGIPIENGRLAMLVEAERMAKVDPDTLRSVEALRHTTVKISLSNEAGELLFQNPAAIACYGNHSSTPENQHLQQRFLNQNIWLQAEQEIKATGIFNGEFQVLTKQGVRWHSIEIRQTKDPINGFNMLLVNEHDISDLKETEEKLRWKETLLRSMANASPLAFYVVDNRSDEVLYFNPQFCQIWGIKHLQSPMQQSQLKNNDIIPHCVGMLADIPAFAESCKPLQSEENRIVIEDEIPFRDGRTIRRFSTQIRDQNDRYFGRLYIFEDITERKQIEEQLQLADFSVENSSLATVWIDRTGKIIRANKRACEQQNFSQEELLSMYVWDSDPNFPQEAWLPHWEELKRQKSMSFSSEHYAKDGRPIPVEITLNYLEFNGKEYNFACSRDVSERKQAEAALKQKEQEFRALAENAPDIIMRINREYRYLYINPTVEKHLGIPPREFIGKTIAEFGASESLVQVWETAVKQVFDTGNEQEIEFESPSIKGLIYYATRVVPEFASDGSVQSVLAIARDISDRIEAEKALRQNEERMQALLKAIPDTMFRHRVDGTYLDVQANENSLLVPPEFLIGKKLTDLPMPEHIKTGLLENFQAAVTTGKLQTYEHDLKKPDGDYIYEARIIKSGVDEVVCIVRDITERKLVQKALQESEERYRSVVTAMAEGIVLQDANGIIHTCNSSAERILGLNQEQMMGKTSVDPHWRAIKEDGSPFPGEEHPAMVTLKTGKPCVDVVMGVHKPNGSLTWISINSQPLYKSDDSLPYAVVTSFFDITERKQAEAALRHSESTLRSFFNSGSMMMGIVELYENDILHLSDNQNTANFFGTTPEALQNKFATKLGVPRQHLEMWLNNYWEAVQTQTPVQFEYAHETPAGQKWLSVSVCPIATSPNGRPRLSYIVEDISGRKQSEVAIQQALAAAQAASIAKSRFLSQMSHELRTPLNAILGFSQMMARSSSLSSEQQEQLRIINRSGEHLLNLINDILSMSKIEAGQETLNENQFDLYQLLYDLEQMLRFKAASKGLQLVFERAVNVPQYIETDENKLRQVLINLIGNAIKFTEEGTVYLRVALANRQGQKLTSKNSNLARKKSSITNDKAFISFAIEDTGSGIAAEEIDKMFDPFVQTETGRKSMQGTGLGLPISRQFVRLMGGNITVTSQLGKGTIFSFDIQVKEAATIAEKNSSTSKQIIGLEPNQPTYRILIVEDIAENRLLLTKLLTPLGFEVQEAINGEEAIALWSTWQPHLIWMDMRMPIMDGYEATKQITTLQQQRLTRENIPKTVIIALTASAFEEERSNIIASGCEDLVSKPFQESVLFEKMAQYLGVRYIYANENQPDSKSAIPKKLTPQDLTIMPTEWIAQLHQAVLCANDDVILNLVEQIPQNQATLAETLIDLVNNFRLDVILDLTQTIISETD